MLFNPLWQGLGRPGGVVDLGMYGSIVCSQSGEPGCIGHGAIRTSGAVQHRSRREGSDHTPTMHALRQSDRCIVPLKFPNKPDLTGAEGMEGRRRRKGKVIQHLPYAGRRAGRTYAVRGMTGVASRRRDDPSEEPGAGNPHARICAGGGPQGPSLPRPQGHELAQGENHGNA
jgi:hypothetical protein